MKPRAGAGRLAWWKIALGPWMVGVILGAFIYVGPAQGFIHPEAARIIFFHVPLAILLIVWFLVAAVFGILMLRTGDLGYDARAVCAAEVGQVCTILATISGSVFARAQWLTWWNWDPKQIAIVIVMFIYFAYFALRSQVIDDERRARLSAVYVILAGVATPFVLAVIPQLPVFQSLHPAGIITTSGGMSRDYKIVFWASVVGFWGITAWIYGLRLRVASVAARLAIREWSLSETSGPHDIEEVGTTHE
jgi:heme exporter protein C